MLSEKPTFSVVIPLYNKERYIARAIRSVLSQSMGDFELLVVDDGSTDGGAAVVETIRDARIRLVKQQNGGECAARNRGITEAHASSIAFLDADDEWLPGHLETIERLAERLPDCGAYATTTVTQDSQGKIQVKVHDGIPAPPWEGVMQNYFRSATSYPVSSSAVAIPKRVFDSVGLFRVGVQVGGDVDMWCRIALRYPIAFSTEVGAVYHKEADNRSLKLSPMRAELPFVRVIQDALREGLVPQEQRSDAFEFLAAHQIETAFNNVLSGNTQYARLLLRSCRSTRKYARSWRQLMFLTLLPLGWSPRLLAARSALRSLAGRRE